MKTFNCYTGEGDLFLSNMSHFLPRTIFPRIALFCETVEDSKRL